MKKIILALIIIIIFGGGIFYLGWINVPEGSFGILYSSFTGIVEKPIEGGNFNWYWQKVIPKTYTLKFYEKKPIILSVEETIELPGSQELKDYGDFYFKLGVTTSFQLNFESVKELSENGLINQYKSLFKNLQASTVKRIISDFILDIFKNLPEKDISFSVLEMLKDTIKQEIQKAYNTYKIKNVKVDVFFENVPSFEGYRRAHEAYIKNLELLAKAREKQTELEASLIEKQSLIQHSMKEKEAVENNKLDTLKKYGELFREYPELLKYMYLERFGEKANIIVVPTEPQTGFPKILETLPYQKPLEQTESPPQKLIPPLPKPEVPELEKTPQSETELKIPKGEKEGTESTKTEATESSKVEKTTPVQKTEPLPPENDKTTKEFGTEGKKSFIDKLKFWEYLLK